MSSETARKVVWHLQIGKKCQMAKPDNGMLYRMDFIDCEKEYVMRELGIFWKQNKVQCKL